MSEIPTALCKMNQLSVQIWITCDCVTSDVIRKQNQTMMTEEMKHTPVNSLDAVPLLFPPPPPLPPPPHYHYLCHCPHRSYYYLKMPIPLPWWLIDWFIDWLMCYWAKMTGWINVRWLDHQHTDSGWYWRTDGRTDGWTDGWMGRRNNSWKKSHWNEGNNT